MHEKLIISIIKSHILSQNLERAYREMALDEKREAEANEWIEGLAGNLTYTES